jgi:hypothetical protein
MSDSIVELPENLYCSTDECKGVLTHHDDRIEHAHPFPEQSYYCGKCDSEFLVCKECGAVEHDYWYYDGTLTPGTERMGDFCCCLNCYFELTKSEESLSDSDESDDSDESVDNRDCECAISDCECSWSDRTEDANSDSEYIKYLNLDSRGDVKHKSRVVEINTTIKVKKFYRPIKNPQVYSDEFDHPSLGDIVRFSGENNPPGVGIFLGYATKSRNDICYLPLDEGPYASVGTFDNEYGGIDQVIGHVDIAEIFKLIITGCKIEY